MRSNICAVTKLFNIEQIKKINEKINLSLIESKDNPSNKAIKTSQVKFIKLFSIQNLIMPFIDFCYSANNEYYGFDLFSLTSNKILNYNTYNIGEEYSWHIDADMKSPIRDVKLTCLLNLSEEKYDGGDLFLFRDKEVKNRYEETFGKGDDSNSEQINDTENYHQEEEFTNMQVASTAVKAAPEAVKVLGDAATAAGFLANKNHDRLMTSFQIISQSDYP